MSACTENQLRGTRNKKRIGLLYAHRVQNTETAWYRALTARSSRDRNQARERTGDDLQTILTAGCALNSHAPVPVSNVLAAFFMEF